jgi:ABC-type multidrug transport system fused ATPase/permease subunit
MWDQVTFALQESLGRVLSSLASFLPAVVAMLVAVLLALAAGIILRWLLRRILSGLRFDERLDDWGLSAIAEWSPGRSPTRLVGLVVIWGSLLLGVLVGLAALEATLMTAMLSRLIAYLPNVFVAILLVVVGSVLARFLARGVLIGAVNLKLQSPHLLSLGVKWLVLVLSIAMALEHLSVGGEILKLAFGILFGGIVLAMALALGLGSKDLVSRTWERQAERQAEPADAPFQHL